MRSSPSTGRGLDRRDPGALGRLIAEDSTLHISCVALTGREGLAVQWFEAFTTSGEDAACCRGDLDGEHVVFASTHTRTALHRGLFRARLGAIAASGAPLEFTPRCSSHVHDGRLVAAWRTGSDPHVFAALRDRVGREEAADPARTMWRLAGRAAVGVA